MTIERDIQNGGIKGGSLHYRKKKKSAGFNKGPTNDENEAGSGMTGKNERRRRDRKIAEARESIGQESFAPES